MEKRSPFTEAIDMFRDKPIVTVGCGTTCGCLGDERSLREFLVADETARLLREAGHGVISLLIDDSYDPLTLAQLRIAFHKDEAKAEKWSEWCGKPLAHVPDPWDCHQSYAAHFEAELLERLQWLGCCTNLISTSHLYEKGAYEPYVRIVLGRYRELSDFVARRFPGYQPENLFRVLCPTCGCIDQTVIKDAGERGVSYACMRCGSSGQIPLGEAKGKLNWKLDCAARWALLNIDAEPFNKAYLEPRTGSYVVAQEISKVFFGGHDVMPLHYGLVTIDRALSYRLLDTMPGDALRDIFVRHATADMHLTQELVMTHASRYKVESGLSYLDCIKQLVPLWLLRPQVLGSRQMELVGSGIAFAETFMNQQISTRLPSRECMEDADQDVLRLLHGLLEDILQLRTGCGLVWEGFIEPAKELMVGLGDRRKEVTACLRSLIGQKQGPPPSRLLYMLPVEYLQMLEYVLDLYLTVKENETGSAAAHPLRLAA